MGSRGRAVGAGLAAALLAVFVAGAMIRGGRPGQVALLDVGVFNAIYLFAIVSCARPRTTAPRTRVVAWRLAAAALATTAVGNVWYSLAADPAPPNGDPGPLPGALYLAAYPLAWAAVVLTVRDAVPRFPPSLWWDGAITGLGTAAVLLALPAFAGLLGADPGGDPLALVYPVADLVELALLATAAGLLHGRGAPALVTAGVGLAVLAAGDVTYLVQEAAGRYIEGGVADVVDLTGVLLIGVATGLEDRPPAGRRPGRQVGWPVLVLPATAAAGSTALLAVPGWGGPVSRGLATGCLLSAVVRLVLTLREIRDLGDVHREARTDELTGLPNRRAFAEEGDVLVAGATARCPVAMVVLDVDGFKEINDTLGHAAGDALLAQLADRLRVALPGDALAARLAGDEFAVLLPGTGQDAALAVAAVLQRALARDFALEGLAVRVTTSIGVACAPASATTRRDLLRCADVAMYRVKADGGGPLAYRAVPGTGSLELVRIAEELRGALAGAPGAGRLVVHLQPQVRLTARRVVGMEALVRWDHPVRGLLLPDAFLTAARTAGLMGAMTTRVLDLGLAAARRCRDAGHPLPVSVNVSAASLHDGELPGVVSAALGRHALPADALVLELTEDSLMTRLDRAREMIIELRRVGVRVSIDDYGTGYSSLAYLCRLPVDELKLDRAFLQGLAADRTAGAVVRHTVELAASLGVRLVAEGVEDEATQSMVLLLGGDVVQGYHVAAPMPLDELFGWLAAFGSPKDRHVESSTP